MLRRRLRAALLRVYDPESGHTAGVLADRAGMSERNMARYLKAPGPWDDPAVDLDTADRLLLAADDHLTMLEDEDYCDGAYPPCMWLRPGGFTAATLPVHDASKGDLGRL